MNDTKMTVKDQKPKTSRLAVNSLLIVIVGGCALVVPLLAGNDDLFWSLWTWMMIFFCSLIAIVLGIIAIVRINICKGLCGTKFAALGVILGFVMIFFLVYPDDNAERTSNAICKSNLHLLGNEMRLYAKQMKPITYPESNGWCDLLTKHAGLKASIFTCRTGAESKSHYAINPNCEPNSPYDMVLLFETKGGWNQHGGPELLTTENHKAKGSNILFNDGSVRFIRTEELDELKWKP